MSELKAKSRRKFIATSTATAAAAVTLAACGKKDDGPAAPAISSSTGVQNLRFQSTWPAKDIFNEFALDYAKKVNDMTGGELKIEVLPAGAVVPPFGLLDAVSKGTLDGGHGVLLLFQWLAHHFSTVPG